MPSSAWFPGCPAICVTDVGEIMLESEQNESDFSHLGSAEYDASQSEDEGLGRKVTDSTRCDEESDRENDEIQDFESAEARIRDIDITKLSAVNPEVRQDIWNQLGALPLWHLEAKAGEILDQLEQLHAWSPAAVKELGCLSSASGASVLVTVAAQKALKSDAISEASAEIMMINSISGQALLLSASRARITASPSGSTLLHLAAKAGHEQFVSFLLKVGILPHLRDSKGLTAQEVAKKNGKRKLAASMSASLNMATVRGGLGDALEEALADERRVIRMEWYTMPLTGILKAMGGKHSIVVVTVSDLCDEDNFHSYVIEKAQLPHDSNDVDQFKNGIFVSHYADAAPSLSNPRAILQEHELVQEIDGKPLTMNTLWDLALSLGPHNPVHCTCHHQALMLYNSCALGASLKQRMPNRVLRAFAKVLSSSGVDVAPKQRTFAKPLWKKEMDNMVFNIGRAREVDPVLLLNEPLVEHSNPLSIYAAELSQFSYVAATVSLKNNTSNSLAIEAEGRPTITVEKQHDIQLDGIEKPVRIIVRGRDGMISQEITPGERYTVGEDLRCEKVPGVLPEDLKIEDVHASTGSNAVGWFVATTCNTIWVTFRGTQNLVDAVVDICLVPAETHHGVQVQGGMWLSLTQRKFHVLNMIFTRIQELCCERPSLQDVVLCGHSLGGGYAILAALDLLARGVNVTSVLAFGSPQVVVPEREHPLWQKLDNITTVYVNGWDCVPRMPSCSNWLFDIVPRSLPDALAVKIGALSIGINGFGRFIRKFASHKGIFDDYEVVGTLLFLRTGSRKVVEVPSTNNIKQRELLCVEPTTVGRFVLDSHDVEMYVRTIRRLS
eukprot:TRINITY_DN91093_c0_g1_i1.p1 TRINITY_DN91093_c0_g1~~TRINITY_DN91093_c0_g1_i1.p1  ORF type:complete len:839 (+),score=136.30 TRINITY_DN91093_c0_g1_i1:59-2575(+)